MKFCTCTYDHESIETSSVCSSGDAGCAVMTSSLSARQHETSRREGRQQCVCGEEAEEKKKEAKEVGCGGGAETELSVKLT